MAAPLPIITIKAQANNHAIFLLLIGWTFLLITLLVSQYYWQSLKLVFLVLVLVALVIIFTGLTKIIQPKFSYYITPKKLEYRHIYGKWQLSWQQIQKIRPITEVYGIDTITLPYLGIRLVSLDMLEKQISPRLANRLIHEQQPLLKFAFVQQLLSFEQIQLNFTPFTLQSGLQISGPVSAFLHHCQSLQSALGYHLYLPETSMDRELNDFQQLLVQCQQASKHYDNNSIHSHVLNH